MNILRYSVLLLSISAVVILVIFGRIHGQASDVAPAALIFFFAANAFYIFFSKPDFKLSDFFDRTATGLALVTLEVKYQASQAKSKELEAERLRADTEEKRANRLSAAKEFMQFAASNPQVKKHFELLSSKNLGDSVNSVTQQLATVNEKFEPSKNGSIRSSEKYKLIQ